MCQSVRVYLSHTPSNFLCSNRQAQQHHIVCVADIADTDIINETPYVSAAEVDNQVVHIQVEELRRCKAQLPCRNPQPVQKFQKKMFVINTRTSGDYKLIVKLRKYMLFLKGKC